MPSKSKTHPLLNNQKPSQNIPPKSQRPVPPTNKPQETLPANISSVRKAPDPGRLLTKDPHPLPGGCLLPSLAPRCSARSGWAASRFSRAPLLAPPSRFLLCSHSSASPPPLPGALPRPASSLLLPPASAPPPPHPAKQTKTILFHHTLKTPPKCPSLRLYTFLMYMNDKNNI